jgi:hypothetical protein
MEKMTLLLPANTVEMMHLLSRETGQRIGDLVHEMALDRYMRHALGASEIADFEHASFSPPASSQA